MLFEIKDSEIPGLNVMAQAHGFADVKTMLQSYLASNLKDFKSKGDLEQAKINIAATYASIGASLLIEEKK